MSTLQSLESLLSADAHSEEFAWFADQLRRQGEVEKALTILDLGLENNPDLITALLVKAKCLETSSRTDEAIQICAQILEKDDRCLAARLFLFQAALQQGHTEEAFKIQQRILLQDPWIALPELPQTSSVAASAAAVPLAFAAPPLVDDLFGEESIADEIFETPIHSSEHDALELPPLPAEKPLSAVTATDLGPLDLGESLPSSEEVGMAFESLFGASGVEESQFASDEVELGLEDLAETPIESVPEQDSSAAESIENTAPSTEPYLDLAPEDVGNAFDELFGEEGLGSLPEVAELPLTEPTTEDLATFDIGLGLEAAPSNSTELDPNELVEASNDVMEISIVDANADLLDFAVESPALQSELFTSVDEPSSESQELAELDLPEEAAGALDFDFGDMQELSPVESLPEESANLGVLISEDDLSVGFDQLFEEEESIAPLAQELSPLESEIQLSEQIEAEAFASDVFGISESTESLPFFEGEVADELDSTLNLDLNPAMDDIFAQSDLEEIQNLVPDVEQSPFELAADEAGPLDEEQTSTASQASGQTITLAEIYCSQGLFKQALSIYQSVLAQKEDDSLRLRYAEIEELLRQKESGETEA